MLVDINHKESEVQESERERITLHSAALSVPVFGDYPVYVGIEGGQVNTCEPLSRRCTRTGVDRSAQAPPRAACGALQ